MLVHKPPFVYPFVILYIIWINTYTHIHNSELIQMDERLQFKLQHGDRKEKLTREIITYVCTVHTYMSLTF